MAVASPFGTSISKSPQEKKARLVFGYWSNPVSHGAKEITINVNGIHLFWIGLFPHC